jgi:hypothetical protein
MESSSLLACLDDLCSCSTHWNSVVAEHTNVVDFGKGEASGCWIRDCVADDLVALLVDYEEEGRR